MDGDVVARHSTAAETDLKPSRGVGGRGLASGDAFVCARRWVEVVRAEWKESSFRVFASAQQFGGSEFTL